MIIKILLGAVLLALLPGIYAQQINPSTQINWPTGSAGCVYAPGTNTCVSVVAGITSLTGAVTATGPGAAATTITPVATAGTYPTTGVITINSAGQVLSVGAAFSANFVCTQCGTYETGNPSITSATGTVSYSNPTVPTSASVSDGTNTTTLSTPFNSWTLSHAYTTNTMFTLTATGNSQTITRTANIVFADRTFFGVGTCGATGATASGNNAVLVGASGTLGTWGLGTNTGTVSVSPSSQCIYFLLSTTGHSFTVNGFGTTFGETSFTFTNQFSDGLSYFLYSSPGTQTGTYSVVVN